MTSDDDNDMQYTPFTTTNAHDVRDANGNIIESDVVTANIARAFEYERNMLRLIIVRSLAALQNHSWCSHDASIEFMQGIPNEIREHVNKLNAEIRAADKEVRDERK